MTTTTNLEGTMDGKLAESAVLDYLRAGHATVTFRSVATGTRFTYRVSAPKDKDTGRREATPSLFFVALLDGPDNETSYSYLGLLRVNGALRFEHGRKSRIAPEAPSVKAFAWTIERLVAGDLKGRVEVWHAGRCGRCGRTLTVPESVASGYGPECAGLVGGLRPPTSLEIIPGDTVKDVPSGSDATDTTTPPEPGPSRYCECKPAPKLAAISALCPLCHRPRKARKVRRTPGRRTLTGESPAVNAHAKECVPGACVCVGADPDKWFTPTLGAARDLRDLVAS